jgi:hypothetical protein
MYHLYEFIVNVVSHSNLDLFYFQVSMKTTKMQRNLTTGTFPRQSLKRFTSRVKSSDSIFFLFGFSPIVNKFDIKSKSF